MILKKEDFRRFLEIFDGCFGGGDCLGDVNHVLTISRKSWDCLGERERRSLFAERSIHVVGPSANRIFPEFQDWKDFSITRIDLMAERHVHDQTSSPDVSSRLRRGKILHFISLITSRSQQVVNYLDIDMTGLRVNLPNDHLEDGENLATLTEKSYVWRTHWPTRHLLWALLGREGAITQSHMDAGGFCTHVQVVKGQKLWFIALNQRLPTCKGFTNKIRWQVVVLNEGDDL
jgi:hypothetical protein